MTGNSVIYQLPFIIIGIRQRTFSICHTDKTPRQIISISRNVIIRISLRSQFIKTIIRISRSTRSSVADTGTQAISVIGRGHRIAGRTYLYHTTGCIISISRGACGVALRHNIPLSVIYEGFRTLFVRHSTVRFGLFVVSMINLFIQSSSVCRTMVFLCQTLVTVVSIIYSRKQTQSTVATQRFLFHRQAYCIIATA